MPHQLIAGSDCSWYALFDPAALEPFQSDGATERWQAWLRRQPANGRMLECRHDDNDTLHVAVFVDEPFDPPAPHKRRDVLDGVVLRVPSGRLRLCGIEFVQSSPGDAQDDPDGGVAGDLYPGRTTIAPGTYRVTAFRVQYHLPQARRDAELRAKLEPGDVEYVRSVEKLALPAGFALALFGFLAAMAFLLSASNWIWRLTAAGVAILIAVVASLALWGLTRSPRAIRFRTVESEIEKRYPSTVVMLNRLADDAIPATFPPARLGDDGGGGNGGGSNRGAA
jgi:hypothetical protein